MKRAHHRHHADVNPIYPSTHIQNSHAEFSKLSLCSTATNKPSDSKVVLDALINEQEASLTLEQPERISATVMHRNKSLEIDPSEVIDMHMSNYKIDEDLLPPDRQDGAALKKGDSSHNTTEQPTIETASAEQTSPSSISTDVDIVLNDDAATVDQVELVEVQDDAYVLMEDEETKTEDYPTECIDSAADRDNAVHLHTLLPYAEASKSAQQLSITEPPVQNTIAALITQPAAYKSDATPTVQFITELQIQQTDGAVITQPEANKESEATPTVLLTTYVTKEQQCHSKEVQAQDTEVDTAVSMTQPTATQDSESTPQIIIDSDTRPEPYDTKFWYHLRNTDGLKKTPESMSTVFICCLSEYSCVILFFTAIFMMLYVSSTVNLCLC